MYLFRFPPKFWWSGLFLPDEAALICLNCWKYFFQAVKHICPKMMRTGSSWWSCSQLLANLLYWWPGDLRRLLRCLHYFTLFHKSTTCPFGAIQGRSIREEVFKKFFVEKWRLNICSFFPHFCPVATKSGSTAETDESPQDHVRPDIKLVEYAIPPPLTQKSRQTICISLYFLKNYGNCNMFDNVEEKKRQ